MRAQGAVEYLTTYGWAILVIIIVVAVLFYSGVFSLSDLSPKAQPGSCYVYRPNGPLSNQYVSLTGTCNNEIPEFVGKFNGVSSYINAPFSFLSQMKTYTVALWFSAASLPSNGGESSLYAAGMLGPNMEYDRLVATTPVVVAAYGGPSGVYSLTATQPNTWYFFTHTVSYNATNGNTFQSIYINAVNQSASMYSGNVAQTSTGAAIGVEAACCDSWPFNGSIANVQVYNTSLSQNEISALYLEGIGGAPVRIPSLMAWWPLNGNANDYSGNGYNGTATSVGYSGTWYYSYKAP